MSEVIIDTFEEPRGGYKVELHDGTIRVASEKGEEVSISVDQAKVAVAAAGRGETAHLSDEVAVKSASFPPFDVAFVDSAEGETDDAGAHLVSLPAEPLNDAIEAAE